MPTPKSCMELEYKKTQKQEQYLIVQNFYSLSLYAVVVFFFNFEIDLKPIYVHIRIQI